MYLMLTGIKETCVGVESSAGTMNVVFPAEGEDVSYVEYNGKRFNLVQCHFHSASEHTVDGHYYIAEVHHVHAVSLLRLATRVTSDAEAVAPTVGGKRVRTQLAFLALASRALKNNPPAAVF